MKWLSQLIIDATVGIGKGFLALGRAIINSIKLSAAAIVAVALFLKDMVIWIADLILNLVGRIADLFDLIPAAAAAMQQGVFESDMARFINTFIPLQEMISMLLMIGAMYLLSTIVRAIKGWVPTYGS